VFRLVRLGAVAALFLAGWYFLSPPVAGHFGWATRWPASLPDVVNLDGRQYALPTRCLARSRTPLRGHRAYRIGTVPVVFGAGLPILEDTPRHRGDPAEVGIIVHPRAACYVTYDLQGGP
jgi:hypothetical protein